jgi:EamA-like transporter family protein
MLSHGRGSERTAVLALLVVTAVWGSTFFLIKDVVTRLPVADLLAIRFGVASLALAVLVGPRLRLTRRMIGQGAGLGLLYGVAQILQTVGLAHTTASVSGFITGLYVVATPVLAAMILKARIGATTWAAVGLATIGLGVLSLNGFAIGYGELVTLISAVVYAGHIVALGRVSTPATGAQPEPGPDGRDHRDLRSARRPARIGRRPTAAEPRGGLAGRRLSRAGRRRFDDDAANRSPGADRSVPGGGDHGYGTSLGGRFRRGRRR